MLEELKRFADLLSQSTSVDDALLALEADNATQDVLDKIREDYGVFLNLNDSCIQRGLSIDASIAQLVALGLEEEKFQGAKELYNLLVTAVDNLQEASTIKRQARSTWYTGPQPGDKYWHPLERALDNKNWHPDDLKSLKSSSTQIVGLLDNPASNSFQTKGLVVGYVQSGKTASFTSVISKAADRDFRVIIVLAGMTNILRKQTQERLEREIISLNQDRWFSWTDGQSDLSLRGNSLTRNTEALVSTGAAKRHLAVIKKNVSAMKALIRMFSELPVALQNETPVLIIDDECDHASLNSAAQRNRVSTINRLLNEIINSMPRIAYVGYTATPYANVLVDPGNDDLYPRDFITSLPTPTAYFGPERIFGRNMLEADEDGFEADGLDVLRIIPEEEIEAHEVNRLDKESHQLEISESLDRAIKYYCMAVAARAVREDGSCHCSMMIHTTLYVATQLNAQPIVEKFRKNLLENVERQDPDTIRELKSIWESEEGRVTPAETGNPDLKQVSFEELNEYLELSIREITVVVENYKSDERLEFPSDETRKYIVIGGNVLARGLTIEGLLVSYFLRMSGTYDALMQMGRWFGYRPNYEDLPRVWLSNNLAINFKDLALVEQEIRNDIKIYSDQNLTPEQFAVRIRTHPTLAITSRVRMRDAKSQTVNYSGQFKQTFKFKHLNQQWLNNNWKAAGALLTSIAGRELEQKTRGSHKFYEDVPVNLIETFLEHYEVHEQQADIQPGTILKFIRKKIGSGDKQIQYWTIAIASKKQGNTAPIEGFGNATLISRSKFRDLDSESVDIKTLTGRAEYVVDLPGASGASSMKDIYELRGKENPILILYPIDKESKGDSGKKAAFDLEAVDHVMGMAFFIPGEIKEGEAQEYLMAALEDPIDLEELEKIEAMEQANLNAD